MKRKEKYLAWKWNHLYFDNACVSKKFYCRNVNCAAKNSPTAKDIYVKAFEEDMSEK